MPITILYGVLIVFVDIMAESSCDRDAEALYYSHPICADYEDRLSDKITSGRRIVGGSEASIKNVPFAVSIQTIDREHKCGGSLIKPNWVLTAAHCLLFTYDISLPMRDPNNYVLVMGTADVRKGKESKHLQIRHPLKFIPHTEFNHQYMKNDIGLIQVKIGFVVNTFVNLATLPLKATNFRKDEMCRTLGWGYTEDPGVYGEYENDATLARTLQEVDIPVIETTVCQHYYSSDTIHEGMNMCAGYHIGQKDACSGDSGGPLLCKGHLMAIISWGFRCAYPESPGVYTRVDYYLLWIHRTIRNNSKEVYRNINTGCVTRIDFVLVYTVLIHFILI